VDRRATSDLARDHERSHVSTCIHFGFGNLTHTVVILLGIVRKSTLYLMAEVAITKPILSDALQQTQSHASINRTSLPRLQHVSYENKIKQHADWFKLLLISIKCLSNASYVSKPFDLYHDCWRNLVFQCRPLRFPPQDLLGSLAQSASISAHDSRCMR